MDFLNKLPVKIMRKIIFIGIVFVFIFAIGVMASKSNVNSVKIVFADDCEITVLTSEVKVSKILEENYIVLESNEKVYPDIDSNIDLTKTITIAKQDVEPVIVAEEIENVSTEEILGKYVTTTEKIITEQSEILFETVTKDISNSAEETTDRVIQAGENGLKEIKYKIKYQNDVEVERIILSEKILKEPVDRIIQISRKVTSRSAAKTRYSSEDLAASVAGKEPKVVTLNASAYCADSCGGNTKTACGAYASEWYTVAAGSGYAMGTIIYIPYFADQPNGGWFVVQDRGGIITNNHLDIWMGSKAECVSFGRRNLECYIYE